jgi:hypothetical protein
MAKIKAERTWLTTTTPNSLLRTLRGKRLPRQRRLFAVACCRRVLDRITHPACRRAVEVAERFADGVAGREELESAYRAAQEVAMGLAEKARQAPPADQPAAWDVWRLAYAAQLTCGASGMDEVSAEVIKWAAHVSEGRWEEERQAHCDLIRDLFGNPFRPRPAVARAWLAWGGGTVPRLARALYDERAFEQLPVLADALEEAGGTGLETFEILEHLRTPGPHARGCWALDLLLGID